MKVRDPNLDLLRAVAIVLVVAYHVSQRLPIDNAAVNSLLQKGALGVDLFFVISGYLIGGLYWREKQLNRSVGLIRFWLRRSLRTLPPYMAALGLAWVLAYAHRREPFDWRFLLLVQNYFEKIPFFLVSWSLCIEEHFYLGMPLLLGVLRGRVALVSLLIVGLAGPVCLRFLHQLYTPDLSGPGYSYAATHLRLEGLTLGVWGAFLATYRPAHWEMLQNTAGRLLPFTAPLLVAADFVLRGQVSYVAQPALAAAVWMLLLTATTGRRALPGARARTVYFVAISSYSIYLTHVPALHVGSHLMGPLDFPTKIGLALVLWFGLIAVAGTGFYLLIEKPTIGWRDRAVPRLTPSIMQPAP